MSQSDLYIARLPFCILIFALSLSPNDDSPEYFAEQSLSQESSFPSAFCLLSFVSFASLTPALRDWD